MKCLVLAGGEENSTWLLSREEFPKQFMEIKENHSLFQETIARNIPFCDEFYISTNEEYHSIVVNQMKVFQGLKYRCFLEEERKKTAPAIALACMSCDPSEVIFVVSSDQIVEGDNYKDAIIEGIELARRGDLAVFGIAKEYIQEGSYIWNSGDFIVRTGDFLSELKKCTPSIYYSCKKVMESMQIIDQTLHLTKDMMKYVPGMSVEHAILNRTKIVKVIETECRWFDVRDLEIHIESDTLKKKNDNKHNILVASIVKLEPSFKDYLWGGTKLKDIYDKKCDYDIIAESWELSSHKDGESVIAEGRYRGMLFSEYLRLLGSDKLGWKCQAFERFPILIKFIDAKQALSIQVHPDDEFALREENEYGKNELWYIMDCEEGAYIYYGVNKNITKGELEERVKNNTVLEVLNKVEVHPGDTYFVEAGTIHAIGAGILICEIQQNSNCTYRLYDYDRRDKYGNTRELHIEKARDVSNLNVNISKIVKEDSCKKVYHSYETELLSRCKYFECHKYSVHSEAVIEVKDTSFCAIVVIEGEGKIAVGGESLKFKALDTFFIPAGKKEIFIQGQCSLIKIFV